MTRKRLLVRDQILDLLDSLPDGSLLPAERTLSANLGVSRMTVRNAVDDLVLEGRVERRHGSGTYARRLRTPREMKVISFSESTRKMGLEPSSRVISLGTASATQGIADRLGIEPGARVYVLQRTRFADQQPVAIETLHTVYPIGDSAEEGEWDGTGSFYDLLRSTYGVVAHSAVEDIEATILNTAEAEHLNAPAGTPAFLVSLTTRSADGKVIEFVRSVSVGTTLRVNLTMTAGDL